MKNRYNIYCGFDMEKHKQTYINYLEVMIDTDGKINYAIPSHQEYAIKSACNKLGVSRDELSAMTPPDFYFDWLTWLLMQSGEMAVWNDQYMCPNPTRAQYAALRRLKLAGLYCGRLPERK